MASEEQSNKTTAHVLVLEDDDAYRELLCTALVAYGHRVTGAFARANDAVAALRSVASEVAIVDLMLPDVAGDEAIKRMRKVAPELRVLVLTAHLDREKILACIAAGADGYLLKGSRLKDIALSVADVRDGHAPISPEAARHLLDGVRPKVPSRAFDLTRRERDVLELLARGLPYEAIAKQLAIGTGTVQTHIKSLYKKLDVSSKAEAVSIAMRAGILPAD